MLHIESYIWAYRINSGSSKNIYFFPVSVQCTVHSKVWGKYRKDMVSALELEMPLREHKSARIHLHVYINILERGRLSCDHKSEYGNLYTWANKI